MGSVDMATCISSNNLTEVCLGINMASSNNLTEVCLGINMAE